MPGTLQPLDPQFAITDPQGRPTLYFIKWAQQKQIDITGSAQLDGGNDFTGDQNIDGNLTVTDGGVTLKADPTSPGFTVADRAVVPGHQINFISNAPITGGGAVLNVFAAKSSAAAKNLSQISLWTVPPTDPSIVQGAIRAATGASGEELILLTQQFGVAGLTAGDIVFEPNTIEKLRVLAAAGDPAVKVTGQLSVTDDPYSASWDGSTDVPTKNAVYDKIQTMGGGGGTETLIQEVVTSASQASVSFAAIAATYRDLRIMVRGRGSAAAGNVNVQLQFNGDTATNYEWSLIEFQGGTNFSGGATTAAQIIPGVLPAASASALAAGIVEAILADYRGTTFHKSSTAESGAQGGATGATMFVIMGYGRWKSAAAINAVKVFLSSGNFVDGSVVSLYGRM